MTAPSPSCADTCPLAAVCADRGDCAGTVTVAEALERWEREAVHSVCDTGRYRCAWTSWGTGPPLIFVPGLGQGRQSFMLVMALLAHHFRCLTYDLPTGDGDGACLRRYGHADLVEDLFAVLDQAGVEQSYVHASSFGATVALAALRARPQRLRRAILQGGFAHRPLARAEVLLAHLARFWPGRMGNVPGRLTVLRRGHAGPFATRPPEAWEFFVQHTGTLPIAALAQRALWWHRIDLRPILADIRQPVLLVSGDRDPVVGKECAEVLLRGLPNAGRVELPGSGHFPHHTHPEALAEMVCQFLTPPRHGVTSVT